MSTTRAVNVCPGGNPTTTAGSRRHGAGRRPGPAARHVVLNALIVPLIGATGCVGGSAGAPAAPVATPASPVGTPLPTAEVWSLAGWQPVPAAPASAPTERWRIPLRRGEIDTGGGVLTVAEPAEGGVTVRRIDPSDGTESWSARIDIVLGRSDFDPPQLSVLGDGSTVLFTGPAGHFGARTPVVVLDSADGRVIWRGTGTGVDALGELILVSSPEGTVAVDRRTGTPRWRHPGQVTIMGGLLVVAPLGRAGSAVGVLDPATGRPRWQRPVSPGRQVSLVGGTLLVTPGDEPDRLVIAYDAGTGAERWRAGIGARPGRLTVHAVDDTHALLEPAGGVTPGPLAMVDLATGTVVWRDGRAARATALRIGGRPYLRVHVRTDGRTTVELLDALTGRRVGSPVLPFTSFSDVVVGGAVYYCGYTDSGAVDVVALRLPQLTPLWRVRLPTVIHPLPGGFAIVASSTQELVGYLG